MHFFCKVIKKKGKGNFLQEFVFNLSKFYFKSQNLLANENLISLFLFCIGLFSH